MAKIFGDEVVVTLEDVHINHNTHELVIGNRQDNGLEHVATHQGLTPEMEKVLKEEMEHKEKVNGV